MSELKATVVAKDGKVLLGNDIIQLEDRSYNRFSSDSIDDFIRYVLHHTDNNILGGWIINYSSEYIILNENIPGWNSKAHAVCELKCNPLLKKIIDIEGKTVSLKQLDEFLWDLRSVFNEDAKTIYDLIQNFSVKKVTEVNRTRDKFGNFSYLVARRDVEKMEWPAKVAFCVPVYDFIPDTIFIEFDFYIDFKEGESEPQIGFKLKNSFLAENLRIRQKAILDGLTQPIIIPKFWGYITIEKCTDEWKYKRNELKIQ